MPRQPAPNEPPSIPDVTGLTPHDAGGQGEVYVGRWRDGRKVAVRIEPLAELDPQTARLRANQEGNLLARLAHPNLVPLLAHGTTDTSTYVVMEYVEGVDLGRELARRADRPQLDIDSTLPRGVTSAATRLLDSAAQNALLASSDAHPVPAPPALGQPEHWRWVAAIGVQLCGALDRLHSAGFLHRDIKPRNVMVKPDGGVVLVDLGLATAGDLVRVASDDSVAGTWAYMSPEQRQRQGISTRSDIYGVGCTLYECLTGRPPRTIASDGTTTRATAPPSVRLSNATVPETFAEVVAICLDPIPSRRYLSARDLGDDLLAVIAGRPRGWRRRQWSRRSVTATAVAFALGITGMTWWVARRRPPLVAALEAARAGDTAGASSIVNAAEDRIALLDELAAEIAPNEIGAQRWLAGLRKWGLIEVEQCAGIAVGFCQSDLEYLGTIEQWQRPTTPLAFVVAPGIYKIAVVDLTGTNAAPASTTVLVRAGPSAPCALRCGEMLSTRALVGTIQWCRLPSGQHKIRRALKQHEISEFALQVPDGLEMARDELDWVPFAVYLDWVRDRLEARGALFAHPDEPPDLCTPTAIEALRGEARAIVDEPIQLSFWWAHRVAGFLSARLPTANEWCLAAQSSYSPATAAPVDGLPPEPTDFTSGLAKPGTTDPHVGTLRINYLLDSAREWTCSPYPSRAGSMFCPVGGGRINGTGPLVRVHGTRVCIDSSDILDASNRRAGIRLVRDSYRP